MLDRRDTETGSASSLGVDGLQELVDFVGEERDLSFTVDRNVRLDACVPARLYAPASRLLEPSTHRASRAAFIDVFNELKLKEPYTCAYRTRSLRLHLCNRVLCILHAPSSHVYRYIRRPCSFGRDLRTHRVVGS